MIKRCFLFLFLLIFSSCGTIKKGKGYEIGVDPTWYPLSAPGMEPNILAFSIDVLKEIAKKEKLEITIINRNWDNLLWGLREKKYNGVLSSMRPYPFYTDQYDFSTPYLLTGPVLIVPKKSPIHSKKDLTGREVGVVKGSSAALLLQSIPGIILRGYDSIAITLNNLEFQQVEAAAIEVLVAQSFLRDIYEKEFKMVAGALNDEGLRLLSLHGKSKTLMTRFDQGLNALKTSGKYEALLKKWGLAPDSEPVATSKIQAFIQQAIQ